MIKHDNTHFLVVWTVDHVSNKPGCMVGSVPLDGCHAASGAPDPTEQQLKTPVRYACDAIWHLLARGTYRKSIKTEHHSFFFPSKCAFELFEFIYLQAILRANWWHEATCCHPSCKNFSGWTSCEPMEADDQSGARLINYWGSIEGNKTLFFSDQCKAEERPARFALRKVHKARLDLH